MAAVYLSKASGTAINCQWEDENTHYIGLTRGEKGQRGTSVGNAGGGEEGLTRISDSLVNADELASR